MGPCWLPTQHFAGLQLHCAFAALASANRSLVLLLPNCEGSSSVRSLLQNAIFGFRILIVCSCERTTLSKWLLLLLLEPAMFRYFSLN